MKIAAILYKSKTLNDGTHPIMIRVSEGKGKKYMATTVAVMENQWKPGTPIGTIVKHPQAAYLNGLVNAKFMEIAKSLEGGPALSSKLSLKKTIVGIDFSKFGHEIAQEFDNMGKHAQADCYRFMLKSLGTYYGSALAITDINIEFTERFRAYLNLQGKSANTIRNYTSLIMTVCNKALQRGYLDYNNNPFRNYKLEKPHKSFKVKLTDAEFEQLIAADIPVDSPAWLARATFLLQYYLMGMRIGDVLRLRKSDVSNVGDTFRVLYRMNKNQKIKPVLIIAVAKPIVQHFMEREGEFLLPYLDGYEEAEEKAIYLRIKHCVRNINRRLDTAAKAAGITKHITTHVSRHSFASMVDRKLKDPRLAQAMLEHSDFKTTESYLADLRDDGMDEAMLKAFKKEEPVLLNA